MLLLNGLPLLAPHVGVGVYTTRLIEGLMRQAPDFKFQILLPDDADSSLPSSLLVRVPSSDLPQHPLLRLSLLANGIGKIAARDFPEAIFHSPGPFYSLHQSKHCVITLHDCIYRHFPRYLGKFFLRKQIAFATERYAARSSMIFTDSECSARDLEKLAQIPREKLKVFYPWVGEEFEPVSAKADADRVRQAFNLPSDYWLYLGGYDYRKNVEFLIHAYASARKEKACPPLVLAGKIPTDMSKPFCDIFGAMRSAGLSEKEVLLPGMIPSADLPGLYAAAALLIYPSLYEGFGLPPAEAIAVGTAALVADNSSLVEVVTNPVCRFNTESSSGLSALLLRAAENPSDFLSSPNPQFTEWVAISQYLKILRLTQI